jgi:hypothetical protein
MNTHDENFLQGCYFFLSALSAERKKKKRLGVLCDFAVKITAQVKQFPAPAEFTVHGR